MGKMEALQDINSALDFEIAELLVYRGLTSDDILRVELDAKIAGMQTAKGYIYRALKEIE